MRLHYTTEALAHLEAINDFLTQRNPAVLGCAALAVFVYGAGHTRGEMIIIGVFHGAQDWEDRSK